MAVAIDAWAVATRATRGRAGEEGGEERGQGREESVRVLGGDGGVRLEQQWLARASVGEEVDKVRAESILIDPWTAREKTTRRRRAGEGPGERVCAVEERDSDGLAASRSLRVRFR